MSEYMMATCWCGDSFSQSGDSGPVHAAYDAWKGEHADCLTRQRAEAARVFWLSFADGNRPKGSQFLGACLVEVTAEDAAVAMLRIALGFPNAEAGAHWIGAAVAKAHELGCNPGGEVAAIEVTGNPNLSRYRFGVLMDRATIEGLDR